MQQNLVVIRLQDEEVALGERVPDLHGRTAQVRRDPESQAGALVHERDAHRVHCVVHGQEGLDPEVSHGEGPARAVGHHPLGVP